MKKPSIGPQRRTNPLIWCAAIICAIVALAVIVVGLIVLISYLIIHPKTPSISVSYAHLNNLYYNQMGNLAVQLTIVIQAKNHNAKTHANFYDIDLIVMIEGEELARLVNKPFDVEKNSSVDFNYQFDSAPILLGKLQGNYVQTALRKGEIKFELKGKARTKWRVWVVGWVKFSLILDCQLHFFYPNGNMTTHSKYCVSKAS